MSTTSLVAAMFFTQLMAISGNVYLLDDPDC